MYKYVLLLHVLAATVWTGGHLVLTIAILPRVMRERSPRRLLEFESAFEKMGIPALAILVISGPWMALQSMPDASDWFVSEDLAAQLVRTKLILLAITALLAVDTRLRIIPRLREDHLVSLAWHIVPVTVVAVLFVVAGVAFRVGGFP